MTSRPSPLLVPFLFTLVLSLVVSGCSGGNPFAPKPTATPTPQPTPIATATSMPDRVVLVATASDDAQLTTEAQQSLAELAAASGLVFETRADAGTISTDVKIIIFLSQPVNLGSLANNTPGTQFAAVSNQDYKPAANVTIIKLRDDHVAFAAGFISEMLAPNYRAGALLNSEDAVLGQAFSNGARYYCGICLSTIFPYTKYPLTASNPVGSPASAWQTSFDQINAGKVQVLYVDAKAASAELMAFLANKDVVVFGSLAVPNTSVRWAGTLAIDAVTALKEIWPELLAGKGGRVVNAAMRITQNQPQQLPGGELIWLSDGKIALLNQLMQKLRADQIYPFDVPQ